MDYNIQKKILKDLGVGTSKRWFESPSKVFDLNDFVDITASILKVPRGRIQRIMFMLKGMHMIDKDPSPHNRNWLPINPCGFTIGYNNIKRNYDFYILEGLFKGKGQLSYVQLPRHHDYPITDIVDTSNNPEYLQKDYETFMVGEYPLGFINEGEQKGLIKRFEASLNNF